MKIKIILAILFALSLIVNGIFLLNQDSETDSSLISVENIANDAEGYPKPQINIKCANNKDCYDKENEMGVFCNWGHTIDCGFDNFCRCIELTEG